MGRDVELGPAARYTAASPDDSWKRRMPPRRDAGVSSAPPPPSVAPSGPHNPVAP